MVARRETAGSTLIRQVGDGARGGFPVVGYFVQDVGAPNTRRPESPAAENVDGAPPLVVEVGCGTGIASAQLLVIGVRFREAVRRHGGTYRRVDDNRTEAT